jgi:hypothetical protein
MDCSDKDKKSYRERYKSIGESDWFKEHYEGKSLGEIIEDITENQKPMPPEFSELINEHFWDLVD